MKTVLLLRHAKSSRKDPNLTDHERPLNKRGKRDAPRVGRLIEDEGLVPDLIVSSTAVRARATAEAVAVSCGFAGKVEFKRELYLAEPDAYLRVLWGLPEAHGRVLVVGHNPGLERLLEALTGSFEALPTAALARVALPIARWRDLTVETRGMLLAVWRPKEGG